MIKTGILLTISGMIAQPLYAQEQTEPETLLYQAFEQAKSSSDQIEVEKLSCTEGQRQIIAMHGAELRFPCMILELVQEEDDAAMAVTLLLSEAPPIQQPAPSAETPLLQSAAAIATIMTGTQLDDDMEAKRIQRYAAEHPTEPTPSLASYFPKDSEVFKAEVSRVSRENADDHQRERVDRRAREMAAQAKRLEVQSQAQYQSVTDFLNLAKAAGFCPADGRAFLARAVQYSTSPIDEDRMVGLWASDRHHGLEAYLNDLSRCR